MLLIGWKFLHNEPSGQQENIGYKSVGQQGSKNNMIVTNQPAMWEVEIVSSQSTLQPSRNSGCKLVGRWEVQSNIIVANLPARKYYLRISWPCGRWKKYCHNQLSSRSPMLVANWSADGRSRVVTNLPAGKILFENQSAMREVDIKFYH